ncbi:ATP-binding protein [Microbacterium sp. RD1]|uniref:ATP-binding protein n=1 Tax=Microbacterium sp. RD1 TaxID=3457313 RepID=UPI003FA553C8
MASLTIGRCLDTPAPAELDPAKLNRHTFWTGQSGSGKTYALGVLLEQVLLATRLPIVVMDPNSDFVRLGEVEPTADTASADALRSRSIRVLGGEGEPLKIRFVDLPVRSRAAIMQIDPVTQAEDFNVALHVGAELQRDGTGTALQGRLVPWLHAHEEPQVRRFARLLENTGVADWDLWAWGAPDARAVIDEAPDATVLDLGSLTEPGEAKAAALAVLDHLWADRLQKTPRLIVLDEAHNFCAPDPVTPVDRLLTERIVQIAAEGRKFGLWLLLSTQRPSKVHPQALSQCDNVAVMRMNSPRDLADLAETFGFLPRELLERCATSAQGEALFGGSFAPEPAFVKMRDRLTAQGGSDVPVPLR